MFLYACAYTSMIDIYKYIYKLSLCVIVYCMCMCEWMEDACASAL